MLTDKDIGIKKFILDRLEQITDEAEDDPEYLRACARENWGSVQMNYWSLLQPNCR